jgi:hypothetical protein
MSENFDALDGEIENDIDTLKDDLAAAFDGLVDGIRV